MMEVVVTTGAIGRAKLQSNCLNLNSAFLRTSKYTCILEWLLTMEEATIGYEELKMLAQDNPPRGGGHTGNTTCILVL